MSCDVMHCFSTNVQLHSILLICAYLCVFAYLSFDAMQYCMIMIRGHAVNQTGSVRESAACYNT